MFIVPPPLATGLRSASVQLLSPFAAGAEGLYHLVTLAWIPRKGDQKSCHRCRQLELEKVSLTQEVAYLADLAHHEGKATRVALHYDFMAAPIIYRSDDSWSHSVWIHVGNADNVVLGKEIVAIDSPVLFGASAVGVIDYVGRHTSRVRLITDPRVSVAVRVKRGREQDYQLIQAVELLEESLTTRDGLFETPQTSETLLHNLDIFKQTLAREREELWLAKGELNGTVATRFRKPSSVLKGVGFNYDVADEMGPARDLRTGATLKEKAVPLIVEGDLLVTSGFDGLFPKGLHVARVIEVKPLKEGAVGYELSARATACDFDQLNTLFVIPPLLRNRSHIPL